MNPLLANNAPQAQNNNLPTAIKQIKQRIMGLQALGNPSALTNFLTQNNQYFQQAAQYVAQNGGNINNVADVKAAMEKVLQDKGKNVSEVYNALR